MALYPRVRSDFPAALGTIPSPSPAAFKKRPVQIPHGITGHLYWRKKIRQVLTVVGRGQDVKWVPIAVIRRFGESVRESLEQLPGNSVPATRTEFGLHQ